MKGVQRGKRSPNQRFTRMRVCAACMNLGDIEHGKDRLLGRSTKLEAPECQRCHERTRWGRMVEFLTVRLAPAPSPAATPDAPDADPKG
jgi:hypothetical protein